MTPVYLHEHLADEFGHFFEFDVHSPAEAVRALCANFPDFSGYLIRNNLPGYYVRVSDTYRDGPEIQKLSGREPIHFIPVVAGGGDGKGLLTIIAGVALIAFSGGIGGAIGAAGLATAAGATAGVSAFGLALALGGVSQLLFKPPKSPKPNERPENKPSFVFDGPVNTIAAGHPVPVGYGELIVGSAVISAGIITEDIPA
jgi:predicted phage tail protein